MDTVVRRRKKKIKIKNEKYRKKIPINFENEGFSGNYSNIDFIDTIMSGINKQNTVIVVVDGDCLFIFFFFLTLTWLAI